MKLRIIACPRSGTHYITEVLRNQGLDVKHQKWGKDGIVSWSAMFDDGICGADNGEPCLTLHQIREPLGTIGSLTTIQDESWEYIMKKVPEINSWDDVLLKAMKMYYCWNTMCSEITSIIYKIENVGKSTKATRKHPQYSWDSLFDMNREWCYLIEGLAEHYGYRSW